MNGIVLEIIAEAEITQHFKEGVMTRGITDVLKIIMLAARAHAALRSGGALVISLLMTKKEVLELHHASVRKEQRRIIARHQRTGGNDGVTLAFVIVEELLADFAAFHGDGPVFRKARF